jgi:hypothetical protein
MFDHQPGLGQHCDNDTQRNGDPKQHRERHRLCAPVSLNRVHGQESAGNKKECSCQGDGIRHNLSFVEFKHILVECPVDWVQATSQAKTE